MEIEFSALASDWLEYHEDEQSTIILSGQILVSSHDKIDSIPGSVFDWAPGDPAVILRDDRGHRWFLATDIARALGYSKYDKAIRKHAAQPGHIRRYGEIKDIIITDIPSRTPRDDWRFLSEEGLYHFISVSKRKPKAIALKTKYLK